MPCYGLDNLDPVRDIRLTLLEAAPRILPPLSEHIAIAATELLGKLDVTVRTGERVTAVDGRRRAHGRAARCCRRTSSSGRRASRRRRGSPSSTASRSIARNQLVVDTTLQTTRDPDIFAFGDCAACPVARSESRGRAGAAAGAGGAPAGVAARQDDAARLAGKPLPTFHFRDFGSLVSLGELSAVGNLMGRLVGGSLLIQGLIARWMYASLYKMHQVSIHGYLRVALDTVGRFLRRRTGAAHQAALTTGWSPD